ncbi:restriction endonuclease subunit S [Amphritea sp.]|uniref:restriction endonuclease subunit S n=1 Tax=Amphritea sp. TaxID=1872502 RepID=UPI003A954153
MSWPVVKVGDVCSLMTGGTPKTKVPEYYEGGDIPWIVSGDIHKGEIFDCEKKITSLAIENSNARYLPKNSVLIALNGQGKTRGTVALLRIENATCNQSIVSINPNRNDELFSDYLFYYLKSIYQQIRNITGDKDRAGLNMPLIREIEIPLPPLAEQKRIAAILDKADALRRKRQQAIDLADQFLRSVFLDMFGDPVSNPKGWGVSSLPKHGAFKNGLNFGKGESGNLLRYLGVGNFKSLTSIDDVASLGFIELNDVPAQDYLIRDGDLVFVRSNGNKALVGRCISVYPADEKLTFSGFCIRYRVEDQFIEPEYLNYLFRMPSMKHAMLQEGQGANIQNINQQILSRLSIPLPPIDEQLKFCRVVEQMKCLKLKLSSFGKQPIFESLSQQAFSGKL